MIVGQGWPVVFREEASNAQFGHAIDQRLLTVAFGSGLGIRKPYRRFQRVQPDTDQYAHGHGSRPADAGYTMHQDPLVVSEIGNQILDGSEQRTEVGRNSTIGNGEIDLYPGKLARLDCVEVLRRFLPDLRRSGKTDHFIDPELRNRLASLRKGLVPAGYVRKEETARHLRKLDFSDFHCDTLADDRVSGKLLPAGEEARA